MFRDYDIHDEVEGACHLTSTILFSSNLYRAIIDNFIYSFYQLLVPNRLSG